MAATLQRSTFDVLPLAEPTPRRNGFTLVELLVTMVVLLLLMLVMVGLTDQTSRIWHSSRTRIDAFQSARNAFERITSHVSQATLNTYLDYYNSTGQSRTDVLRGGSTTTFTPSTYGRASDLQFVCGQAAALVPPTGGNGSRPTHAIFFQAPLGYVSNSTALTSDFKGLHSVLNGVGYYIDFGNNSSQQPAFMTTPAPIPLYRYRLMELYQPSQNLSIYFLPSSGAYSGSTSWFYQAVNPTTGTAPTIVTSDNVVALIVRPESASAAAATNGSGSGTYTEIAPQYSYDTKSYSSVSPASNAAVAKNQLPPLVQVTMVAIDGDSATQLAAQFGTSAPPLYNSPLYSTSPPFTDVTQYSADLAALETVLRNYHLNYHVFVANVSILGAQWSQ